MLRSNRKVVALFAAAVLVLAAFVAPAAASAKGKVPVNLSGKLHLNDAGNLAGKVSGTVGSKSVSKVSVSGTAAPPKMTAVFHLSGGTLVAKVNDGHTKNGVLHGTFKLSGTGKYASATGSGNLSASLTTFVFTFKG